MYNFLKHLSKNMSISLDQSVKTVRYYLIVCINMIKVKTIKIQVI